MKRIATTVVLAVALAGLAAAPAQALRRPTLRDASARLAVCHQALTPLGRYMLVDASMGPLGPGERLQIRFDLYRRYPLGTRFLRVSGPGLGYFYRAAPGASRFRYLKRVGNLPAADYRMVVYFRWVTPAGRVLMQAARYPLMCRQADLRPDLQIPQVSVVPGPDADSEQYLVVVRNAGRLSAFDFDVGLTVGGVALAPVTVSWLGPVQDTVVSFVGPRCGGGPLMVAADVGNRISEASELNNNRAFACLAARRAARR